MAWMRRSSDESSDDSIPVEKPRLSLRSKICRGSSWYSAGRSRGIERQRQQQASRDRVVPNSASIWIAVPADDHRRGQRCSSSYKPLCGRIAGPYELPVAKIAAIGQLLAFR